MNEQSTYPVVAVIPSLNPDEKLLNTVNSTLEQGFTELILVDDGSKKECRHFFEELSKRPEVTLLTHEKNRGKGAALRSAFSYYLEHYDQDIYQGVVTADADGQHLAEDIKKTAETLLKETDNGCTRALVLGTRDFDDPIVPFKSKNGNKITTNVFQLLYGKRIHDTQTGLRGISNAYIAECLNLQGERFEYEINMLVDAVLSKAGIFEELIQTVYLNDNRETHFDPVKDSIKIYRVMFQNFLKFSCAGLCSMLLDQGLFAILVNLVFVYFNTEKAIVLSTVAARICSSLFNYKINKNVVFGSKQGKETFFRYYLLCVMQMLASAFAVSGAYALTKVNSTILKLIVDLLLFFVSYRIQQKWVFVKEEK